MERAGSAHAGALAAIHAAAFPAGERWGAAVMAAQLDLPGVFGWIDGRGGMVLARAVADEAEVLTLGVAAGARRLGVGRGLLGAAMAEAAARGAGRMFLEVSERNSGAVRLYLGAGFAVVGRRRAYYVDGGDALVLGLALRGETNPPPAVP